MKQKLTAIVLTAGEGKRMKPLGADVPKIMLPILGKPVLEYILTNIVEAGASEWATPTNGHATNATGQFNIADERSSAEMADVLRRMGYEPVWKDWDAALTA